MGVWDRFEGIADTSEVAEAREAFKPLNPDTYECTLESLEATENKDGLPMIKGAFQMTDRNRKIFYNQNLQNVSRPDLTKYNLLDAERFMGGLLGEDYTYTGITKLAEDITAIGSPDSPDCKIGETFQVTVSYGQKDFELKFPKLKVKKVEIENFESLTEGDMPF